MSAFKEQQQDEIRAMNSHIMPEMDALRKEQSEMPDDVLLQKCQKWISDLCRTSARCWSLRTPPDPEHDPDLLFYELCRRFKANSNKLCMCQMDGIAIKQYHTNAQTTGGQ